MMNKLKVGVVGTGVLGRFHSKLYSENNKVELVGIYDAVPAQAEKVAKEFSTAVFPTLKDLAQSCDALTVAVPATLHYSSVMELINMKKHVLVEKPIADDVDSAEKMVSAAQKAGIVFGVGHVERFNPAIVYLKNNCTNPLFMEIHRMAKYPPARPGSFRRGTEVGVVLDLMIHDLDLVLSMVNSEVLHFDAFGAPVLSDTEDIANVRITFQNGAVANLTASRVSPVPVRKFRVFQENSYTSMDLTSKNGVFFSKSPFGIGKKQIKVDDRNALADEIDNFVDAVIKTKSTGNPVETYVPGWQGLRALKLAVQISEAVKEYNKNNHFNF